MGLHVPGGDTGGPFSWYREEHEPADVVRFVLPALVCPAYLHHLKTNPTQTKTFLACKVFYCTARTDSTKDVGEVVAPDPFTKVKLLHLVVCR